MTIEEILLSKNRDAFDRIMKMMKSLIVKNEVDAEKFETIDTMDAYNKYEGAFIKSDSITDYTIYKSDLIDYGFTESEAHKYSINPSELQTRCIIQKDNFCIEFLNSLRSKRIKSYTENNPYYRPFCGLPSTIEENILTLNLDKIGDDDPDELLLHDVTYINYPKTYNSLYYERNIASIYDKYDYLYLKFIEKPMTPYAIRNKKQFDICFYDVSSLNSNELSYFFEAYDVAKNEILSIDYIEAFQTTYSAYSNIMFMFILHYCFNIYCAKTLERYAVRDYTDDEIYDILDSNNLGNLKKMNMSILRRVIQNLPDLLASTGEQKIIDIIFDIVADKSLTVKKYYLHKKYNIDNSGNTIINEDGLYSNNVSLVFKEKTVKSGEDASFASDSVYDYEEVTLSDDTWGGTIGMTDEKEKLAVKNAMKKELLAGDFSSVMTKYIGLSKIIDIYSKTIELNDKLGILYQINDNRHNFMKEDKVIFNGMEVNVLSIYASWCLIFGTLNGLTNPDYIVSNVSTIESIMKLRSTDKLRLDTLDLSNISIDLGNGYSRTLGSYFTEDELQSYLVKFNYNENTTIEEIISQYDTNKEIIDGITTKLNKQTNYAEYTIWLNILKANQTSVRISKVFNNYTQYSAYINANDGDFYKYIESIVNNNPTVELLVSLEKELKNSFSTYIKDVSHHSVLLVSDESDISGGEDLGDIGILFNEFMSYYTQLYKQDFHVGYDNEKDNVLLLLYTKCVDFIISNDASFVDIVQSLITDTLYSKSTLCNLELLHYIKDTLKTTDSIELVLAMERIFEMIKQTQNDFVDIDYETYKCIIKDKYNESLSLSDVIIKII